MLHDLSELDDVGTSAQCLQDLDLPLDASFLRRSGSTKRGPNRAGPEIRDRGQVGLKGSKTYGSHCSPLGGIVLDFDSKGPLYWGPSWENPS